MPSLTHDHMENYKNHVSQGFGFCDFHKKENGDGCTYLDDEAYFKKEELLKMTIEHKECRNDNFLMCRFCYDNDFEGFLCGH